MDEGKRYRFSPVGSMIRVPRGYCAEAGSVVEVVGGTDVRDVIRAAFPSGIIRPVCMRDLLALGGAA